jgi:hypothetical protein
VTALAALLALVGCRPDADSDTDIACDTTVTPYPMVNQEGVYYRTPIEAAFLPERDPTATIRVEGVEGSPSWRGNTLIFTPDAPLAPSTTYTATVTHACAPPEGASWSFTTSDVGAPVDPSTLIGSAYVADLRYGRVVQPEGGGSLLQTYLTSPLLVGITSADAERLDVLAALGSEADDDPPRQDTCKPTVPFGPAAFTENPIFESGPAAAPLSLEFAVFEKSVPFSGATFSGAFAPGGDYLAAAELRGELDLVNRQIDGDSACGLLERVGIACQPCRHSSGDSCVELHVDNLFAEPLSAPLEAIPTQEQACARPECADAPACSGG